MLLQALQNEALNNVQLRDFANRRGIIQADPQVGNCFVGAVAGCLGSKGVQVLCDLGLRLQRMAKEKGIPGSLEQNLAFAKLREKHPVSLWPLMKANSTGSPLALYPLKQRAAQALQNASAKSLTALYGTNCKRVCFAAEKTSSKVASSATSLHQRPASLASASK